MGLILALLISTANAGWFSDFCSKQLVAEDPYQFEEADTKYVLRKFSELSIKKRWGSLLPRDREVLVILTKELEMRVQYGRPEEVDEIVRVMENLI